MPEPGHGKGSALPERTPGKLRLPFELLTREFAGSSGERCQVLRDPSYPGLVHFILQDALTDIDRFCTELAECVAVHLGFKPVIGYSGGKLGFLRWKEGCLESLLAWNLSENASQPPAEGRSEPGLALTEELTRTLRRLLIQGSGTPSGRASAMSCSRRSPSPAPAW